MRTMYKTGKYSTKIEPCEITKETPKMVTVRVRFGKGTSDRLESKVSDWHRYHNSESEALDFLIERAKQRVESFKKQTHQANTELGQLLSQKAKSAPSLPREEPRPKPNELCRHKNKYGACNECDIERW
jgi:hypothetical protein